MKNIIRAGFLVALSAAGAAHAQPLVSPFATPPHINRDALPAGGNWYDLQVNQNGILGGIAFSGSSGTCLSGQGTWVACAGGSGGAGAFNALIPATAYTCSGTLALSFPTATKLATANVTVTGNCTITLSGASTAAQGAMLYLDVVENTTGGYSVSLPAPTVVGGNNGWPNNVAPVASTLPYAATYVRYVTPDSVVTQGFY